MPAGPERTCVGCRAKRPKRELKRVVKTPAGDVLVDPTANMQTAGRGAYVCAQKQCLAKALKTGALARALRAEKGIDIVSIEKEFDEGS